MIEITESERDWLVRQFENCCDPDVSKSGKRIADFLTSAGMTMEDFVTAALPVMSEMQERIEFILRHPRRLNQWERENLPHFMDFRTLSDKQMESVNSAYRKITRKVATRSRVDA